MRTRHLLPLALAAVAALAGCQDTKGGPSATCSSAPAACTTNADCCSYGCIAGTCMPNPYEGGFCKTSSDCGGARLCASGACTSGVVCRADTDSCTLGTECCSGLCGTGGKCATDRAPVASAGSYPNPVPIHVPLTLQNASTDPDGTGLYSTWSFDAMPAGSTAAFSSPKAQTPSFTPDLAGTYVVRLVVSDGYLSANDVVTIVAVDTAPVARPRATNTTPVATGTTVGSLPKGNAVTLDGTQSSDPDGDPIATYAWTVTSQPAGVSATISGPDQASASFTPPAAGDYVLRLTVSNAKSGFAEITVHAVDTVPTASFPAVAANALVPATLTATASDADHDALTYTWELVAPLPPGSTAPTLTTGSATAQLIADWPGSYHVRLTVTDPAGQAAVAEQNILAGKQVRALGHAVVDAEYSRALDGIVMVGPNPDPTATKRGMLWVYAPGTEAQSAGIPLDTAPTCLGVSRDGKYAAVGRGNAISVVDLTARTVQDIPLNYGVGDVAIGYPITSKGITAYYAYVVPSSGTQVLHSIELTSTPTDTVDGSGSPMAPSARIRVHPVNARLFLANPTTPGTAGWYKYGTELNNVGTAGFAGYTAVSYLSAPFWITQGGDYLVDANGHVYYAVSTATTTELNDAGLVLPSLRAADDSSSAGLLLAVTASSPTSLSAYSDSSFTSTWTAPLPVWAGNGTGAATGQFAFFDASGQKRLAIVGPTGGNAGIVTYCIDPAASPGTDTCP